MKMTNNEIIKFLQSKQIPQCGDKVYTADEEYEAYQRAINAVEQTTWIPVSERLPEVGKKILVTSYGRVCYAVMISTDGHDGYPIFRLQDSLKERTVCETIAHSDMTSSRIIAWMPLPEPYKGE